VSRIDEALRRSRAGGDPTGTSEESVFAPAWTVTGSGADRAPEGTPGADVPERVRSGATISFSSAWRERLARGTDGHPALVEQFRRLAATLHHEQMARGVRSVMVTSAAPGDGKTLTAVNLAIVLAESYHANVLLVDADLRRPSIPSVVEFGGGTGLSEALRAATEQKLALVALSPGLTLLPAGQPTANSIEAVTSPRMRQILDEATARFDWVVLDAPPVGLAADARLLSEMTDGTLFVVHAGKTQYHEVRNGIDAIGRDRILGVVLNGVEVDPSHGYYYGSDRGSEG